MRAIGRVRRTPPAEPPDRRALARFWSTELGLAAASAEATLAQIAPTPSAAPTFALGPVRDRA
ncbi:hypothetical protein [Sorangium sp. So ce1000]|uniref:hypothetical protein n=1 Tax=Sorangium sp. So ce1000 TaxID=3133325 RepID=UPI003F625C14